MAQHLMIAVVIGAAVIDRYDVVQLKAGRVVGQCVADGAARIDPPYLQAQGLQRSTSNTLDNAH